MTGPKRSHGAHIQSYLLAGLLTITPLIVVWFVFDFFLNVLSAAGRPLALALIPVLDENWPSLTPWLASNVVRTGIAVTVSLLVLYAIGAVASRVIGQRLIHLFERIITRIPLVETIYSAAKKLVDVLRAPPGGGQRVVMLEFPAPGLKTLGFVMQTFPDAKTGEELAAVYVPTALNPTSGFLEILPVSKLVATEIPTDQAMTMIISGGAVAPDRITLAGGGR
jgi:uncharacterized membrane protein